MIYCEDIYKSYENLAVLRGVSLEIEPAQLVSIVGASGAGKSTLLHILGTLDKCDHGLIRLDGKDIQKMSSKELSRFRNQNIGFIFQFHHLLPEFTALENACLPAYIAGENESESNRKGKEILDYLGLSNRMNHKPGQLSGGEQQRVALARSLINRAKILLADEPTGNLDQKNAKEVLQLLLQLRRDYQTTTIIVTHDPAIAAQTDITYRMQDGIIIDKIART